MEFDDKSIIVTGGSLGMGRACAERFAKAGAQVLIVANDRDSVDKAVTEIGGKTSGFVGDVRNSADMRSAVEQAVARHGGVDILTCCAGIQRYGTVVDTPEDTWDDVLDINLKGVYLAAKYAVPEMKRRGGGAIVVISSIQSYASQANVAAYTASKGGINALVRAMALDHAADNITVNTVCPGSIDTPMLRWAADLFKGDLTQDEMIAQWGKAHPIGRVGRQEEVADLVAFLASDKARFITGADMKIDGGTMAKLGIVLPD